MLIADFEKMDNVYFSHYCYKAFSDMMAQFDSEDLDNGEAPFIDDVFENIDESIKLFFNDYVLNTAKSIQPELDENQVKKLKKYAYIFWSTVLGYFAPLSAFIGGIVSQEIIKAITQKFVPINQFMYFDTMELFPDLNFDEEEKTMDFLRENTMLENKRYSALRICLGQSLVQKLHESRIFMIGAGAIGCELLKNYAMLGIGSGKGGHIILTDPDVIEVSNLNRQFLFREKHLRKPKSSTAAASAIQMNEDLRGHVNARLDKIHDGTADIYNEEFFKSQTAITNALDNV